MSGFKPDYFAELAQLEEDSFWFQTRSRLILAALQKYCPGLRSFLEIGCGTGFNLAAIDRVFDGISLRGSELFIEGLNFAKERVPTACLSQMDARNIPLHEDVEVIGIFDVLEHIREDALVLEQIHNALQANGILLVTVPQHEWLWSPVDDSACHVRRYSSKELHRKLERAGFHILRSTSFTSALLPALWISRLIARRRTVNGRTQGSELALNPVLNAVFKKVSSLDLGLFSVGINLPFGGSRLVVAQKNTP